jgi:hypothetical protein
MGYKRSEVVHRLAWSLVNGPIPEGLYVCHRCDNRACYEIGHLFVGTAKDNNVDCSRKGRRLRGRAVTNKQQAWQAKKIAAGRCGNCGKERDGYSKVSCMGCLQKHDAHNERYRQERLAKREPLGRLCP